MATLSLGPIKFFGFPDLKNFFSKFPDFPWLEKVKLLGFRWFWGWLGTVKLVSALDTSSVSVVTWCIWAKYSLETPELYSFIPSIIMRVWLMFCKCSSIWYVGTTWACECRFGVGSLTGRAMMRRTWAPDWRSTEATCSEPRPRTLTSPIWSRWSPLRRWASWDEQKEEEICI